MGPAKEVRMGLQKHMGEPLIQSWGSEKVSMMEMKPTSRLK
jgi:hypothetical protein